MSPGLFPVFWSTQTIPISYSFSPFTKPLGTVSSAQNTIGFTIAVDFFSSQARFKYMSLFLFSFIFTLGYAGTAKSPILQILFSFFFFFLFVNYLLVRFSSHDLVICLYRKIPKNFVCFILYCYYYYLHKHIRIPYTYLTTQEFSFVPSFVTVSRCFVNSRFKSLHALGGCLLGLLLAKSF